MTIEARIVCRCRQLSLPDLGLELVKGQVEWLPEDQARASRELALQKRNGSVYVHYLRRYLEMTTRPSPPWSGKSNRPPKNQRRAVPRGLRTPDVPNPGTPPPPNPTMQSLLQEVRSLRQEVIDLRSAIEGLSQGVPAPPQVDAANVAVLVVNRLRSLGLVTTGSPSSGVVAAPSTRRSTEEPPRFIPSGLVDTNQEVSVSSSTRETGVGKSAARLRELKSGKSKDEES
jgi:hypothetical protein